MMNNLFAWYKGLPSAVRKGYAIGSGGGILMGVFAFFYFVVASLNTPSIFIFWTVPILGAFALYGALVCGVIGWCIEIDNRYRTKEPRGSIVAVIVVHIVIVVTPVLWFF